MLEQERSLQQRMKDLEAQNAVSQRDPAHLAKLEKQVQQFEKGVWWNESVGGGYLRLLHLTEYSKASEALGHVQKEVQRSALTRGEGY